MENSNDGRYTKLMEGSWFSQFRSGSNPWMARYVYSFLFLIANLVAWAVRDYGYYIFNNTDLKGCNGGKDCYGDEGALRVSFGCFLFYILMFLSTIGTSKWNDRRESWHSGWWFPKITIMVVLLVLPFFIPPTIIKIYGDIAHFGAGVFLLIQLVSVISFITWLNDCCHSEKNAQRCRIHVMCVAIGAYVICIIGIVLMYIWYTPKPSSCILNIFFITWTIVLLQLMTSVSLHPKVNAGYLNPGFMGLYVVFLCWSAIRSEPPDGKCFKVSTNGGSGWFTIISFVVAVLAIVIATFSTGCDSNCFQFRKKEKERGDVQYGYGFFHFVYATGAMYFVMLLIGWNTHHSMKKLTIDVGWTSTWVRIVNEWLAVCVYIWMMVVPIIWKNRQQTTESQV